MNDKENIKIAIILGIALVAILAGKKILDSVLEALNLQDTKEERQKKEQTERLESFSVTFFNPNYYRIVPKGYKETFQIIPFPKATEAAELIHNSIGFFSDSPEKTKAGFSYAKTKADVSKIAHAFQYKFGKDLLTWISDKLDTQTQKNVWLKIMKELNNLPNGFTK